MYSVEEVADLLGLHVRTVRGYIRDGRLKAVRIGKQYRITRADLAALTGLPHRIPAGAAAVEVSSIVQVDGVGADAAARLATLVQAGANTGEPGRALRCRSSTTSGGAYERDPGGGAAETADVLRLLDEVIGGGNALLDEEGNDG